MQMPDRIRKRTELRENEWLSPHAARSAESLGRPTPEPQDQVRTCFQRDRDRILHSKAFRRLKHKTQVFIDPQGDHYRTRMTHSLEVAQIARTIGRALQLNEDLIEAIALAHDVGHTPFGHAGESALDEALRELGRPGFRHYEQSLRVVDVIEPLNLSEEVRLGIGGHSKGEKDLSAEDGEVSSTLEAAVVRISDRIAYMNHDVDDALRSGMISEVPDELAGLGSRHGERIEAMVMDVIQNSMDEPRIHMSDEMLGQLNWMKSWLFEDVYRRYPILYPDIEKAQALVKFLFLHFCKEGLPEGYSGVQGAVDYVAGMTDRFAMETFRSLTIPSAFRV